MLYRTKEARDSIRGLVATFDGLPKEPEGAERAMMAKLNKAILNLLPAPFEAAAEIFGEPIARQFCKTFGGGDDASTVQPSRAAECFAAFVRLIDPWLIEPRPAQSLRPNASTNPLEARIANLEFITQQAKQADKAEYLWGKLWDLTEPFDSAGTYDDLDIWHVPPLLGDYLRTGLIRATVGDFDAPCARGLQEIETLLNLPVGTEKLRRFADRMRAEKAEQQSQLEIDRDTANAEYSAAEKEYGAIYDAAENAIQEAANRAHAPIQARFDAAERRGWASEKERQAARRAYDRAMKPHEDKYAADMEALEKSSEAPWNARTAKRDAALKAADEAHAQRCEDRRKASEAARIERYRKEDERRRQADARDRKEARRIKRAQVVAAYDAEERASTPAATISLAQAAARLGMTKQEFERRVASGKYPKPRDDGSYDRDTVDALPRPERKPARMMAPRNVLTGIIP